MSGVTSLRTAGSDSYHDVAINNLVKNGRLAGPEIVSAGIFVQPNLGEDLLADTRFADLPETITSEDALRKLVQINIDRGARVIKTRATERAGSPDTDPRKQVYSEDQLKVIVDEASKSGIPVMAHSHGAEGSAAAVNAGVRSIEHGTYLTKETLKQMKAGGIFLVPTYTTVVDLTEPGGDYDHPVTTIRGLHMLPQMEKMIKLATQQGVDIVASTDSGYGPDSINRVAMEAANFVSLGISHFDAIRSCTSLAAELLNIDDHTGRIAEGYDADLIIIERNPFEDIRSLQDAIVVISNGQVVKNRLPFGIDQ
jgi:imidazolonepropionase-like amidohydrolase